MSDVITFEKFEPGRVMGEATVAYDSSLGAGWQAIFGSAPTGMGAGLAVVLMMRAYLDVVAPRPPGNVHARQQFSLQNLPAAGEAIRSSIRCAHKEMRRERRYVELECTGTGAGERPIYTGRMTLIWAA